jgi:hypothetical protein
MYGTAVRSLDTIRFRRRFEFFRQLLTRAPLIHGNTQLSFDQLSLTTRALLHRSPKMRATSRRLVKQFSQTRNRTESTLIWRLRLTTRPNTPIHKTSHACGLPIVKPKNPGRSPAAWIDEPRPIATVGEHAVIKPQDNSINNNTRNINKINSRRCRRRVN